MGKWVRSALVLLCVAAAACAHAPSPGPHESPARLSLLALGDTGEPATLFGLCDGQRRVGEALAAEDERRRAGALLLLGDNFYPRGLRAAELEPRVRENLVRPYCRFIALGGADSARVADACADTPRPVPEVPIYAVLGNHDYGSRDSPELERDAIVRYVSNWHLGRGVAERIELGHGVTLILLDSTRARRGADYDEFIAALRGSRGPWRIVVAHHPLEDDPVSLALVDAIERAGVPVQLWLAGHLHSLRAGYAVARGPALQIVSGGGSGTERSTHRISGERFKLASPGFVRVELVGERADERLRVTILRVGSWPWLGPARAEPIASFGVTRSGEVKSYFGAGPGN